MSALKTQLQKPKNKINIFCESRNKKEAKNYPPKAELKKNKTIATQR
jgi:hypothetical protein